MRLFFSGLAAITLIITLSYKDIQKSAQIENSDQAWEHSIILDISKDSEKKLAKSLKLSTYTCLETLLTNFVECSIKDYKLQSRPKAEISRSPLISSSSINGDSLKVYKNKDGSTHMEIFDNSSQTHHYYSFTSDQNLILYSRVYQDEIFPENLGKAPFKLY